MNRLNVSGLISLIHIVLKRGKENVGYFYYFPAVCVLIEVIIGLFPVLYGRIAMTFSPDTHEAQGLSATGLGLVGLSLLLYLPLTLIRVRIAFQSAHDKTEDYKTTVIGAVKRIPRLIWKYIVFAVFFLFPVFLITGLLLGIVFIAIAVMNSSRTEILIPFFIIVLIAATPFLFGLTDLFLIRIVSEEKKEIRGSLSYLWKNKNIVYPLYALKTLLMVAIIFVSFYPVMSGLIAEGVSSESWTKLIAENNMKNFQVDRILLSGSLSLIWSYFSYLLLAVMAFVYVKNPSFDSVKENEVYHPY
jgi:hypothetical protein